MLIKRGEGEGEEETQEFFYQNQSNKTFAFTGSK